MIKYDIITTQIRGVTEVICDCCTKNLELRFGCEDKSERIESYKGLIVKYWFGYGSLKDGEQWSAVICEACIENKLDSLIKFQKESIF